jgi:hypothetical protein
MNQKPSIKYFHWLKSILRYLARPTGVEPATYGSVELLTIKSYVNFTSFSSFNLTNSNMK